MSLFNKPQATAEVSESTLLNNKYRNSRSTLLLCVVFTLINMIMAMTGSDTYFLFSAYVPYYLTLLGVLLCGHGPEDFYIGEYAIEPLESDILMWALAAVALVILIVYFVLWLLSLKPRPVVMILALALFIVDTVGVFVIAGIDPTMIIDYLFHAYVIYSLITGIIYAKKLRELN